MWMNSGRSAEMTSKGLARVTERHEILKKHQACSNTPIKKMSTEHEIKFLRETLEVSRSGYYDRTKQSR
jgi:DNA-binding transcriptional regulator YiaG